MALLSTAHCSQCVADIAVEQLAAVVEEVAADLDSALLGSHIDQPGVGIVDSSEERVTREIAQRIPVVVDG